MLHGPPRYRIPPTHRSFLTTSLDVASLDQDGDSVAGGGFGRVYLGATSSGARVAVKRQPREAGEKEVGPLARVQSHPNVLQLFAHGIAPPLQLGAPLASSCHYMVVEELDRDLFDTLLEVRALPEEAARSIFVQAVRGMAHLHRLEVCHRDLKLENLMLRGDTLKIIDFGLAHVGSPTALNDCVGSPAYCPPEVLMRMLHDGRLADVWSLGVVLFSLTIGFWPFEHADHRDPRFRRARATQDGGGSTVTALLASCYGRPVPISAPLVALIDSMLVVDPAARATLDTIAACEWLRPAWLQNALLAPVLPGEPSPPTVASAGAATAAVASSAAASSAAIAADAVGASADIAPTAATHEARVEALRAEVLRLWDLGTADGAEAAAAAVTELERLLGTAGGESGSAAVPPAVGSAVSSTSESAVAGTGTALAGDDRLHVGLGLQPHAAHVHAQMEAELSTGSSSERLIPLGMLEDLVYSAIAMEADATAASGEESAMAIGDGFEDGALFPNLQHAVSPEVERSRSWKAPPAFHAGDDDMEPMVYRSSATTKPSAERAPMPRRQQGRRFE